ncbi:MAG: hypothetical protein LBI10_02875 [Deltaproteobacteria bacterium]|nr:hypothetical protein [Deltaproteobacteria bacterium]
MLICAFGFPLSFHRFILNRRNLDGVESFYDDNKHSALIPVNFDQAIIDFADQTSKKTLAELSKNLNSFAPVKKRGLAKRQPRQAPGRKPGGAIQLVDPPKVSVELKGKDQSNGKKNKKSSSQPDSDPKGPPIKPDLKLVK